MGLGKAALTLAIVLLLVLSSGCIGKKDEPVVLVKLELRGAKEQNVVQGNNTTFIFAVENNWKENATIVMSAGDLPKDWTADFSPRTLVMRKATGDGIILNVSVPEDAEQRGHKIQVTARAQGSDVHQRIRNVIVYPLTSTISPELNVVSPGDTVYVNYTGMLLDGTVFDTTVEDVGDDQRINKTEDFAVSSFDPRPFHADAGELVEGFDEGFANMRKGETKSFFIHENKAYSRYEEVTMNLTETIPLREEWDWQEFRRAFRQEAAMWMTVTHRKWAWTAQVVAIDDEPERTVTIQLQVSPGDVTNAFGWDTEVVSVNSSADGGAGEVVMRHNPQMDSEAKLYNKSAPKEFDFGEVLGITETAVRVRVQTSHHALAGKHLVFVVTIHDFGE